MTTSFRSLALLSVVALAAGACGGDPEPAGGGAPAVPATGPGAPPPAAAISWDPELLVPRLEDFLPPPGSGHAWIPGIVVDEAGAPVPGATVEMLAAPRGEAPGIVPNLHARTEAGPDGRFRVGPGPDPWGEVGILSAYAPGYARTSLRSSRVTRSGLAFADEGTETRVVLRKGIPVEGRVAVRDGLPPDGPVTIWAVGALSFHEVVTSDAEGNFSVLAPPGPVVFSAMSGAHGPSRADLLVEEGGENRVSFVLSRGRDIRGRVVDLRTGDPVPGAVIRGLYGRTRIFRADAEGRFELPRYWFRAFQVRAPGYAERTHPLTAESGGPRSVPEVVRLAPGCVVRGRAVDLDGRPLEGVRIRTVHEDVAGDLVDVIGPPTAADGSFTFVGVPLPNGHGELRVFGIAEGFAFGVSGALRPSAGEVLEGVTITMPRLVGLHGTVRDERGEPGAGTVRVRWGLPPGLEAYRDLIPAAGRTAVGGDGAWIVRAPERTSVQVIAESEAYEGVTVDARVPAHPDSLAGSTGPEPEPLSLQVFRGLAIRGIVRDAAGEPVPRGDLRVEPHPPSDRRNSRDAEVRTDGTFLAGGLQPGRYDFSVVAPPEFLQEVVRGVEAGGPPVEVRLRRAAGISGRVRLPPVAGEPPPILLSLQALGDTLPLAARHDLRVSDREGNFSVGPLAPTAYRVTIVAGDWRREFDRVVVEDGVPTDLGEVELAPGGIVEGRVRVGDQAIAGARVEVFSPLPGGAARSEGVTVSDGEGRFRLGGLARGAHFLSVRPQDRPIRELPFESIPGEATAVEVAVPPGGLGVVEVTDASGRPAEGVRVLFTGDRGGVPFWKEGSPSPGPHATGEDGVLRCAGLPAGELSVFAEKAGVGSAEGTVTVADGATATVKLRLRPRER